MDGSELSEENKLQFFLWDLLCTTVILHDFWRWIEGLQVVFICTSNFYDVSGLCYFLKQRTRRKLRAQTATCWFYCKSHPSQHLPPPLCSSFHQLTHMKRHILMFGYFSRNLCSLHNTSRYSREYWMIYRGPGFLDLDPPTPPPPFPRQQVVSLLSLPVCRRSSLLTGEGGMGRGRS